MTKLEEILAENIEDYKKAKLIEGILLKKGHKCFVEVDSKYIRIEELEIMNCLSKEKLQKILDFEKIETAKLRTCIGMYNIYYIPIF